MLGKIEYAPNYGCNDTAARAAVEGAVLRGAAEIAAKAVASTCDVRIPDGATVSADALRNVEWKLSDGTKVKLTEDGVSFTEPGTFISGVFLSNYNRKGDWLQTYTGRKFWPLDPRADEIHIEDIAHALSMQCRYGGHSLQFYSVAEHSVHIYRWLAAGNYAPNVRLAGLLHDATEAYVADVPRPLKRHLAGYKDAEALVWRAVAERFGLVGYEDDFPAVVHEGDNRILGDEVARLMVPMDWHAKHDDPIGAEIECWSPQRAEAEFLRAFHHCERLRELAA